MWLVYIFKILGNKYLPIIFRVLLQKVVKQENERKRSYKTVQEKWSKGILFVHLSYLWLEIQTANILIKENVNKEWFRA